MSRSAILLLGVVLTATTCDRPRGSRDPDAARIHTADVARFWAAVDAAGDRPLRDFVRTLQRSYINGGSLRLRSFLRAQGVTALDLAKRYQDDPQRYQAIRETSLAAASLEPEIRALFRTLQDAYPDAVFPDVHFVIGGMGAGGQGSFQGLVVAAEMATRPEDYLLLLAHELAHAQQPRAAQDDLLTRVLREGAADLTAELLTGRRIHSRAYAWGTAYEVELWERFKGEMHLPESYGRWVSPRAGTGSEPGGLGYFLGHEVARSWWEGGEAFNPSAACAAPASSIATGSSGCGTRTLQRLLRWTDPKAFLKESGYTPGPLARILAGARRATGGAAARDPLMLAPEETLYGPHLLSPEPPARPDTLRIGWVRQDGDTVVLLYRGRDTIPLGFEERWKPPDPHVATDARPLQHGSGAPGSR